MESQESLNSLKSFSPIIRDWFLENIGNPSEPQQKGWPEIASDRNVLICAPTGSGKTFAAFLKCLDWIYTQKKPGSINSGIKIVYISPLKALNNDIYRNLELPIKEIKKKAESIGQVLPEVEVAVRTGDTPQKARTRMAKYPPDILITTPESLYIMLTSETYRKLFTTVEYLIVDEIHSICANKRGVHLSITLERLERIAGKPLKRIGLTATINPLEEAARFLAGNHVISSTSILYEKGKAVTGKVNYQIDSVVPREITTINCDKKRMFDLSVSFPVKNFKVLPENTIWPAIFSELLTLIRAHHSTLVFVNNRKIAELVASGLNTLNGEAFVKTHHGSISKEIRQELERQLKEGEITCLVATSSLELGIDIGAIDLVVQVSSPGSVSQVLQRIGRSGHRLDAVSKGVIIPKTRGDLLDSAFVSYQAKNYEIENITVPQNCLDILAQQIVSLSCEGEQECEEIYQVIRSAYPYRDLPRKQFEDVLLMLSDPSPSESPGTMKPRIFYEKGDEKIRSTPLGKRMSLMNGGTIPNKGNYAVYLSDTGMKVGELQEEFVFESRLGDRFYLGSSVWKVDKIEKDRVLVSPSNASGAKIPFWIGDQVYRTYETGKKRSLFLQKLEKMADKDNCLKFLSDSCGLDRTAAENLREYIADQMAGTHLLPGAGHIICEHFSDEVGDRRIIIHSPFGGKIHAPLAVLIHSKLTRLLNCRMEYIYNNDGILFHIFGYNGKLSNIFSMLDRESMEDELFESLPSAPLFNINLRYNLTRSLLVELQGFGKRTPLWIQRLRCAEVAESILKQPDHPTVVETYRECMNDIFDIRSLYDVIEQISLGRLQVKDVYTEKPSPFSSELIFNFWQIYQYSYDLPVAERRNQLLVNDRDFIQLAAGANGEYELLDPRAIAAVENELNEFKYNRVFHNADELYYFLYSFGELKAEPYSTTVFQDAGSEVISTYLGQLEKQRRIIRTTVDSSEELYWVAAEDFPLYATISGLNPEGLLLIAGLPGEEIRQKATDLLNSYVFALAPNIKDAAVRIIRRHILYNGPFTMVTLSKKYAMKLPLIQEVLQLLLSLGEIYQLKVVEPPSESIFCHRKVYERIKQKTIVMARSDIKPKAPENYCSYLFLKHHLLENVLPADEKLLEGIKILEGQYFPVTWWEDFILPSRIPNYESKMLDYLCSTGIIQWVGKTNKNTREVAFFINREEEENKTVETEDGQKWLNMESPPELTLDEFEMKLLEILDNRGASFLKDLSKALGISAADIIGKLERLVWYGIVANDSFTIARYYMDVDKKNSPWTKYNTYPTMGRWYRTTDALSNYNRISLKNYINTLLDRYGIISREVLDCDKGLYRWSEVYAWLKNNEFTSGIRRGFYISGLSGIQFSRDKDLERIRMLDASVISETYVTLCSCDPANPYKDILASKTPYKTTKQPGTAVVFRNGAPILLVKEFGNTFQPMTDDPKVLGKAAACFIQAFHNRMLWTGRKSIFTEYWKEVSGEDCISRIEDCPIYDQLQENGYERGYTGITLWRKSL